MKFTFILFVLICSNIKSDAQKFDYYYEKAQNLLDSSSYSLSKSYYDSALMNNPKHANSYFNRGLCEKALEDYDNAIKDFTFYMTLVPNDGDAYSQRAGAKRKLKDTLGCLRDYDSSLMLMPNDYETRVDRGIFLGTLDSMTLALKDFDYAVNLDSTKIDGVYNKGVIFYYMNKYDSAIRYLNRCVQIDSLSDLSLYYRAKAKYYIDDYNNALKDINEAIRLNKGDYDYFIARALIYIYNESEYDDDLAEEDLYTAIKMGSKEAQKLLDEYFSDEDN